MRNIRATAGFTLIELLVVIGTIAVLAAVLFPVFGSVRERTRQTTCASNLKQIGVAMALYSQDSDGLYGCGVDPLDKKTGLWALDPVEKQTIQAMPYLQDTLAPYLHATALWRCPSDSGFDSLQEWGDPVTGAAARLAAHPSAYETFNTSYKYNTLFALHHKQFAASGYVKEQEVSPAGVVMLSDLTGSWHGHGDIDAYFYMALFGDGHVKRLDNNQWADAFFVKTDP